MDVFEEQISGKSSKIWEVLRKAMLSYYCSLFKCYCSSTRTKQSHFTDSSPSTQQTGEREFHANILCQSTTQKYYTKNNSFL